MKLTILLACIGVLLLCLTPTGAITEASGAQWIPIALNTPQGPVRILVWAKLPTDAQKGKPLSITLTD